LTFEGTPEKLPMCIRHYVNITSKEYPEGEIRGQINSPTVLSRPESGRVGGFSFNATGTANSNAIQVSGRGQHESCSLDCLTNLEIKTKHLICGDLNNYVGSSVEITDPEGNPDGCRFYRVKP
jgi:hypothetical protein